MKAILRTGVLALAAMLALSVTASAGSLEDGLVAYARGNYAVALKLWLPHADQGHAEAQNNLGVIYANGRGVPQDYVSAHMWFSLAADHGFERGRTSYERLAKRMTPDQVTEAQRLTREWMAMHQR
jgi:TPR repeat protein